MTKYLTYIYGIILVAVVVFFQTKSIEQTRQIKRLKTELVQEYTNQIDSIGFELVQVKISYSNIDKQLNKLKRSDSIQDKRLKFYRYKLKRYEKKTNINHINSLKRDSLKKLLAN
jgi:hypothetical protein